jgi:alkanesulfonate monooxygenase SsuD/methylene tetrahydromethanopterin reductase-like flavin-dependent oxidoreductase (luciferase family)
MKFGLFDHVDRGDTPLAKQLDERIAFVAGAEEAGFHSYHVAEHHATPLNLVPVPGVYLGAIANATRRIRLGPLVYLLPLYSPLRLIEEICILDHLSHGRLDIGVGRGVSPFELNYHHVDHAKSREVFADAFEAIVHGLTHDRLDHKGPFYSYTNVPMELKPHQQPHPPFWYPSSGEQGATWSGQRGLNFSTLGSVEQAGRCIAAYKAAFAQRNTGAELGTGFIGANRHIVVADTEEDAYRIAQPAYQRWYDNLTHLERQNVNGPRYTGSMFADVREAVKRGSLFVGSPDTVRVAVATQIAALGVNYMILGFFFGTLSYADATRSRDLFAREVMPTLAAKELR